MIVKNLRYLMFIPAILLVTPTFAQNEKMSLGVKLIPGMTNSTGKLIDTSIKPSYGAGLVFTSNFTSVLGIETGISFRNYGYKSEITFVNSSGQPLGSTNAAFNYDYLSLPLLLRLNVGSFYFSLGANLDFLISAKANYGEVVMVSGTETKKEDIQNTKKLVVEPTLAIGYQFNINDKFGVNLEGMFSYTANGVLSEGTGLKLMNFGLGIGLTYFIAARFQSDP
jgi:hypothetical protein